MGKVVFMGILLSKHGIGPTAEKVRAVKEATRPSSASEVRSFLGLVGFSSRFIPDFATKAEPLRVPYRKDEKFLWGKAQEEAFNALKEDMAGASMLAYFDRGAPTEVIVDASLVGLGAVLVQEVDGNAAQYVMLVEVLVTLNVGTVKLKRRHLRLFGPAKDLICTCVAYPSLT